MCYCCELWDNINDGSIFSLFASLEPTKCDLRRIQKKFYASMIISTLFTRWFLASGRLYPKLPPVFCLWALLGDSRSTARSY